MIRAVSDLLVSTITSNTPDLGTWVELNSLSNADDLPPRNRLAVALYAIEEHSHLRNRPQVLRNGQYVRQPIALRLEYLMAFHGDYDESLLRLERVVQVFHTLPILRGLDLTPDLAAAVDSVTIRLVSTTADERNQIWSALGRSAWPALFYQVDVAPVDLIEREGNGVITAHELVYEELA